MKRLIILLTPVIFLVSCEGNKADKGAELAKLKQERADLDAKIKTLEAGKPDTGSVKITPVSVTVVQPAVFNADVEVQSQIVGDENVFATAQAPGTVKSVLAQAGEHVSKGQVLAVLDASTIEHQIEAMQPQLTLQKSVYEKQQKLWSQNIGTEIQLMTAKANYEATEKQIASMNAQKDLYRVVSPINGIVDNVNLKVGEAASPGIGGIWVVNYDKLKAEAKLGENYLGKIKQGDPVNLVLPDISDSITTALSYVSQAVDPNSRAFTAQVRLSDNNKLHPNMACIMKIFYYKNANALVVPVSVIQNTSQGATLYIADGNTAKSVTVTTGHNSNGQVEILSGLQPGDKVITAGFEELDNGQRITIQ